jgi:hypothetical protein
MFFIVPLQTITDEIDSTAACLEVIINETTPPACEKK